MGWWLAAPAGRFTSVASTVFGSAVLGSVGVVVSEVPGLAGLDYVAAAPACCVALGDGWCESVSEAFVCWSVAAFDGLLHGLFACSAATAFTHAASFMAALSVRRVSHVVMRAVR